MSSGNNKEELFPEHAFIGTCLRAGITINDLRTLTYVDVLKILISFLPEEKPSVANATQNDIDKLLG